MGQLTGVFHHHIRGLLDSTAGSLLPPLEVDLDLRRDRTSSSANSLQLRLGSLLLHIVDWRDHRLLRILFLRA